MTEKLARPEGAPNEARVAALVAEARANVLVRAAKRPWPRRVIAGWSVGGVIAVILVGTGFTIANAVTAAPAFELSAGQFAQVSCERSLSERQPFAVTVLVGPYPNDTRFIVDPLTGARAPLAPSTLCANELAMSQPNASAPFTTPTRWATCRDNSPNELTVIGLFGETAADACAARGLATLREPGGAGSAHHH